MSSPNIATLDGHRAVVVGDRSGHVYAFSLATGRTIPGWPATTGGVPVDATPSVAPLEPGSPNDVVFVGVGDSATPHEGGYEAFNPDGTERWYRAVKNPPSDASAKATSAVQASLSVGDLQGAADVVAPSVGQEEYALRAATGSTLPGFPWFTSDSDFSTPALADLYGNGRTDIIEGGDQTAGVANWVRYTQGGHLRVISPTGTSGTGSPTGGLECEYNADQVVESSPAVGPFLRRHRLGIAIGTGTYFHHASDTDKLLAFDSRCHIAWQVRLDGATGSSPALAGIPGQRGLVVLEGTDNGHGGGSVYALAGPTGRLLWRQRVEGEVIGSVVTAGLKGGNQDVIVPTTRGAQVLAGRSGRPLATLADGTGLQNSPLVTDDPNGTIGVTVAGYDAHDQGRVEHFELSGFSGVDVDRPGTWPMFHHDPQLTGNATGGGVRAVLAQALPPPRSTRARACSRPAHPNGYYEVDSAGAVSAFGNVAYCGSLSGSRQPGARQRSPVVGMAATRDGGGYWLVKANGEVYNFGDANLYGPAGRLRSRAPVVAMAATPDDRGYWLVARNGAVFSFGDARFYGPRERRHWSSPISSIASSRDGHGYWLVARNGTVFSFGDAVSHGLGPHSLGPHSLGSHSLGPPGPVSHDLGSHGHGARRAVRSGPVVAIAADTATNGYWLVRAGGTVQAFDAPAFGSISGFGLADPVTGIEALPGGTGYRLVDTGGEVICFGAATDLGSAARPHRSSVVVGIAAP